MEDGRDTFAIAALEQRLAAIAAPPVASGRHTLVLVIAVAP